VTVESVRKVFNDGNHNAFTDLCRFRDRYYLTFRSCPDGHHVFTSSRVVILSSGDGERWEQAHAFSVSDRDVRDPHFLVFGETLFVYTGAWLCDPAEAPSAWTEKQDVNDHLGYCAWSGDGRVWQGPRFLEGTYGHYIWRAAAHGGKAYLCGRRKRAFARTAGGRDADPIMESALLESDDGFVWKHASLFQESYGSETAFLFEREGSILAVARSKEPRPAQVCRSHPPYHHWSRTDLDRNIGGPLVAKWGDRVLVGGRKRIDPKNPRTMLYWLIDDRLQEIAELPSGGDNSYPGFVQLSETRGLLSYYSSHEGSGTVLAPSAIYLAELRLP
jgi:hypothetical protein